MYIPGEWRSVISVARADEEYEVIHLDYQDSLDWKGLASHILPNVKVDSEGNRVRWLKLLQVGAVRHHFLQERHGR